MGSRVCTREHLGATRSVKSVKHGGGTDAADGASAGRLEGGSWDRGQRGQQREARWGEEGQGPRPTRAGVLFQEPSCGEAGVPWRSTHPGAHWVFPERSLTLMERSLSHFVAHGMVSGPRSTCSEVRGSGAVPASGQGAGGSQACFLAQDPRGFLHIFLLSGNKGYTECSLGRVARLEPSAGRLGGLRGSARVAPSCRGLAHQPP